MVTKKLNVIFIVLEEESRENDQATRVVDLYANDDEHPLNDELKLMNEIKAKNLRPIPDGDFEIVHLDNNSLRNVKIGANIPTTIKE